MLRFRTMGRVELVAGDPPAARVVPTQPKRAALLAYLAIATPRGLHRRDTLLALFWPELDQDDARRALRQALHALRRWLGESALVVAPDDRVGLADGGIWTDVVAFERALAEGRPAEAMALYEGDFFRGTFVTDASSDFEQWVDHTRMRLRDRATAAASGLSTAALDAGASADAIRWAHAACDLAPDDEPALRQLMRALERIGDGIRGLRAYEDFARRAATELGAVPAAETTQLAEALRRAASRPPAANGAGAPPVSAAGGTAAASDASEASDDPVPPPSRPTSTTDSAGGSSGAAPPPVRPSDAPPAAVPSAGGSFADSSPAGASSASGAAEGRRRPGRRVMGAMLASLGAAAVAVAWIAPWHRSLLGPSDKLVVADFRNQTRDSLLGDAVTEALAVDLAQSSRVRVLSHSQIQAVLGRMEQPDSLRLTEPVAREVAEREGAKALVTGDVAALGNGYTVSVRLIAAQTGDVIAAVRETAADSTGLLRAVDAVSRQLRRRVGESIWSVHASPPLEHVTTGSLDALRKYSQAIRVGDVQGDDRRAIGILREAVAMDPHFAMAYRKLGTYLGEYNETGPAHAAMLLAIRDRDRLPDRERYYTMGSYYLDVRRPADAIAAYQALLDRFPGDMRALNNIGSSYSWLKDFRSAEHYYGLALASDSSVSLLYNHLATAQLNAGDLDAATRTLAVRARKFPPQEDAEHVAIALALARGEWLGAQRRIEAEITAAGTNADIRAASLAMLAGLAVRRGRLVEAEQSVHAMLDIFARDGEASSYVDWTIYLGFLDIWYRHATQRGLLTIEAGLTRYPLDAMSPLDRPYQFLAYTFALAGRTTQARAILTRVREADSVAGWGGSLGADADGGYFRALGATELAEGRFRMARATLRRAADIYNCPVCALPDLARAYELTADPDSAIATYERYVSTPWSEWQGTDGEFRGTAYLRLGALYEARADTARAIGAYTQVAQLWSTADPELQPDVAHARQRLAALALKP